MDLSRLDPVKLRHLVAVVDSGSFAGAAAVLRISQPSISKSIRVLEDAFATRLFERGRAGARPTRYTEVLVQHARTILAEYELAAAELRALTKAGEQQLAVGASPSMAQGLLCEAIARFRHRWPETMVSVDVRFSAPLLAELLGGGLDLVLSAPEEGGVDDDRLSRTLLFREQDVLVVGANHPLLGRADLRLAALLDYPWIVPRHSARLDHIHAVFARDRLPPPPYMLRCEAGDLARGLLVREPFICLMGEGVLRSDLEAGRLAILPQHDFAASRGAFLFTRRAGPPHIAACNFAGVVIDLARAGETR
ncbi:LysR substrate-binding domain-containing protein [Sphingomonas sp. Mn802worker]|uniref:LysR substrate-binding domain-containing protein n=1 Tax=Sphingomonas sp. Mn802worker TaxID=629773 RepID=UPI000372A816|nr:LysR substrate-binding domain-containing protein [Sphingomonas sp. Mn802worker]